MIHLSGDHWVVPVSATPRKKNILEAPDRDKAADGVTALNIYTHKACYTTSLLKATGTGTAFRKRILMLKNTRTLRFSGSVKYRILYRRKNPVIWSREFLKMTSRTEIVKKSIHTQSGAR